DSKSLRKSTKILKVEATSLNSTLQGHLVALSGLYETYTYKMFYLCIVLESALLSAERFGNIPDKLGELKESIRLLARLSER
ncbi:15424_t:CDS:1, partial [Acaulospora colombiana]